MKEGHALRIQLQQKRQQLSAAEQQAASQQVTLLLSQHPLFQNSRILAAYKAINNEISLDALFELAWQQGKCCYLPVIKADRLHFYRYRPHTPLRPNPFAILEPCCLSESVISPQALDLVLTPLLAFDTQGHRLGMGGGYYDRSFGFLLQRPRAIRPHLVGIAYEWQKVNSLSPDTWDVPLTAIVTDKAVYRPQPYSALQTD